MIGPQIQARASITNIHPNILPAHRPFAGQGNAGEIVELLRSFHPVLMWHAGHRFDGRDGSRTVIGAAGFKRVGGSGRTVYPRVDPVAIMGIVHPGGDKLLLGRQRSFPPGMYFTLAGFVQPGETLEAAVARESAEEAGMLVDPRRVRYVSSQPWPLGALHRKHCPGLLHETRHCSSKINLWLILSVVE